jgi:cytochrome c-type biogenesis protein CcmE
VRLVVALSVAGVLAVFLLYTALAGNARPQLNPSQVRGHKGDVTLGGKVIGKVRGDSFGRGLRFRLRDTNGTVSVPVLYYGAVPDLFRRGRYVMLSGRLRGTTFVGDRGSLTTKCPSKYSPKKS